MVFTITFVVHWSKLLVMARHPTADLLSLISIWLPNIKNTEFWDKSKMWEKFYDILCGIPLRPFLLLFDTKIYHVISDKEKKCDLKENRDEEIIYCYAM